MISEPVGPSIPRAVPTGVSAAAVGGAGICMTFAGVQIALAAGAPLGAHVWGGTQEPVLSTTMRAASVGAALTLTAMATVVIRRAGLIGRPAGWLVPATWATAGFLAINTVGNLASVSMVERFVFGPATAAAAVLVAVVARTGRRGRSL